MSIPKELPRVIKNFYNQYSDEIISGNTKGLRKIFDDLKIDFLQKWNQSIKEYQYNNIDYSVLSKNVILGHPKTIALSLALARFDDEAANFNEFKRFIELFLKSTEIENEIFPLVQVPNVLSGFLYMTISVMSYNFHSWKFFKRLLNAKFEISVPGYRPHYYYGIGNPSFFHPEALRRSATKAHDLYREIGSNIITKVMPDIREDEYFEKYLQTQFLMCLIGSKRLESGAHIGMWADFGRFYAHRVLPILERIKQDEEFAENIYYLFDEDKNTFRNKMNDRLLLIRNEFWKTGSGYVWDSIDTWNWD